MTEFDAARRRLDDDLVAVGAADAAATAASRAYATALTNGSPAAWSAFYRSAYLALTTAAEPPAAAAAPAFARLLALFDDDLGVTLVAPAERERLRARLVEAA
jgi:hypothetical protein